jgi:hypothetical protein
MGWHIAVVQVAYQLFLIRVLGVLVKKKSKPIFYNLSKIHDVIDKYKTKQQIIEKINVFA